MSTAISPDASSSRRLRNRPEPVPTTPSESNERATSVAIHHDHGTTGETHVDNNHVEHRIDGTISQLELDLEDPKRERRKCLTRVLIVVVVVVLFIILIVDTTANQYIAKGISSFLEWVEANPGIGFFAFVGVNFLCTLLFFPVSILAPGGGFVFAHAFGLILGMFLGVCAVFLGAGLGAVMAFICGRYLVRDSAQALKEKYPLFEALDNVLVERGVRIIILLHLCPIIPFNVLNMIAGTTSMKLWTYTWTLVAIIPGTAAYVFFGATAGSLADSKNRGGAEVWEIVVMVVGLSLGIIGVTVMTHYAKKELRRIAHERELELRNERELELSNTATHNEGNGLPGLAAQLDNEIL